MQLYARQYISTGALHCQRMRVSLYYELISSADKNKRERERERERKRETRKRHVGVANSILIRTILLPQRLSCYWGKIVSLRMITNLRFADLRLTTAQQRSTGQNLPSDLYCFPVLWFPRGWELQYPSRWPRGTLYPQKLAITSPTSGGRSVGIIRSRTQTMEFFLWELQ
jgi:hypothetical protein